LKKRTEGAEHEGLAADYLTGQGIRILERNFRCKSGEIDIIGTDEKYLIFFEVKYRSSEAYGTALEAVDRRKMRQICRTADFYRIRKGIGENVFVRFDVIGIQNDRIDWIKDAFP
jgi:putative endonuclease